MGKKSFRLCYRCPFFLCFFLFLIAGRANAQVKTPQQKLDSIFAVDKAHPAADSMKLVIYKAIYRQYIRMRNKEKQDEYIDKSIALAKKLNLRSFEGDAYYRRALGFHGVANYRKAEENYLLAIEAYKMANDADAVAGTYLNMGALYQGIPDYAQALAVSQKAITIYQQNGNDSDLASVYTNIAGIYKDLGQNSNALNYLNKALKIFLDGDVKRGVAIVYNTIGSTYFDASDAELVKMGVKSSQKYDKALENLNKSLKVGIELDDPTVLGPLHRDLGLLYEKMGKRDLALQNYLKSIKYAGQVNNKTDLGSVLIALGSFYAQDKDYTKAMPLLTEALKI